MNPELRKALAFFGAVAALALVFGVVGTRLLGSAAGVDAQLIAALKDTEGGRFSLEIPGSAQPLVATRHYFERFAVEADYDRRTALAAATLDFDGELGKTRVSSLGFERIPFRYEDGEWRPTEGWAPRLTGVVAVLHRRRAALNAGDLGALTALLRGKAGTREVGADPEVAFVLGLKDRSYEVEAWLIRSERDEVLVTEEYRLRGATPDRPVDEKGRRSLRLTADGGEFMFASSLM